jgi:hypothetical protein
MFVFRNAGAAAFAGIAALASASLLSAEPAANKTTTGSIEEVRMESAPRAKQIEPIIVEPVKRVAPKTPDIKLEAAKEPKAKQVVTIEKDPALEKREAGAKAAAKSCGAGTKRSKDGSKCERIASASSSAKKSAKRR